jgi:hypothetical protein
MSILCRLPQLRGGNKGFAGRGITQPLAIHFQRTVGCDDGEGSSAMFMARRSDVLGEAGGPLVGLLDGGGGDDQLDPLADLIGKINDLVQFVGGGDKTGSNIEGTGQVKVTILIDFTIGGKLGKLGLGGHGESSLNLPRVAVGG